MPEDPGGFSSRVCPAHPTLLRLLGLLPLSLPHGTASTGRCSTATPLASLLSCFSLEAWKYGHMPLASPPGASSTSSQCHLVLWDLPRERKCFHGKPSSHRDLLGEECLDSLLPCRELCPPRAPRCSCPPSQRFPKLHTKAKTPSMHSHASLSLRVPVTPRGTTGPESLCPSQPGPVGPQWEPGAHHIPPGSAISSPCSGSCVTYASTSVSPPVSLLSWARGGWVRVGDTPWDPPPVPLAGLRLLQ